MAVFGVVLGGLLIFARVSAAWASAPEGSIQAHIDAQMPAAGTPGLAYVVVRHGKIDELAVRGIARGDEPVSENTPFLIGSVSKSFTALAVLQLVEAGELDLDAPISTYLDVFSDQPFATATPRQLLSHTSGYSTFQGNALHVDRTGRADELERRVAEFAEMTPASVPGTAWSYSNANYQILGRLVEVVSGESYATYVERHLFEPMGMAHSFVADGQVHEHMAEGHRPWFGRKVSMGPVPTQRGIAPAGGVISTPRDLGRYLEFMLNGHDDILSARGKASMTQPASDASPHYGFGWFVDAASGTAWHDGTSPGFETLATLVPEAQSGAVVLVNAGSGIGFGETLELRNGITARALNLDYDGEGGRWSPKALFIALAFAPIAFTLSTIWAWRDREALRAKTDAFGRFSLWLPLVTTSIGAWLMLRLVPGLFGVPLSTLSNFVPDFVVALVAASITGVLWAAIRLGLAYTPGKSA